MGKGGIRYYVDQICTFGVILSVGYLVASAILVYLAHLHNIFLRNRALSALADSIVISFPETSPVSIICDKIIEYGPWVGGYVILVGVTLFIASIMIDFIPEVFFRVKRKLFD